MASLICPGCKSRANFKIVHQIATASSHFIQSYDGNQRIVALVCDNEECQMIIGGLTYAGAVTDYWPRLIPSVKIEDVPDAIARAAEEAHLDLAHNAYRSAALLARSVVEATAKHLGITSGTLAQKIDKMHSQGHIRELIRDAAHEVRFLGNEMAHGDFVDPITAEEAEEVITLMDEVLEEVFQTPARVSRRRAARIAKSGQPATS